MGAFSLIFGILGLGAAACASDKGDRTLKNINRLEAIDNSAHYYNKELQDNITYSNDKILEMLSGLNRADLEKRLYEEHGGCVWGVATSTMIKRVMQNMGYDYKNKYDTPTNQYIRSQGKMGYNPNGRYAGL